MTEIPMLPGDLYQFFTKAPSVSTGDELQDPQ